MLKQIKVWAEYRDMLPIGLSGKEYPEVGIQKVLYDKMIHTYWQRSHYTDVDDTNYIYHGISNDYILPFP